MSLQPNVSASVFMSAISLLTVVATYESNFAQEPAPAGPAAQANYGGGGYGDAGMMGGYGVGMMGGGGYGGGLPLKFMILEGKNNAGNERMKVRTATRSKLYSYQLSSLKPQRAGVGYGGGGFGGEGGYGGGNYGGGSYGGESGGYGGGMTATGAATPAQPVVMPIYAYIFDNEQVGNRTKIELLTQPPRRAQKANMQVEGRLPANPFDNGEQAGGEMGGMANVPRYVRLSSLVVVPTGPNDKLHMSQAEFEIVSQTIQLQIWKADTVRKLYVDKGNSAETEDYLKQLLTEEYETQLARQAIEVESIAQRIVALNDEIARRRAAKDRVIDVQLGRIVLEAQGLLEK